MPMYEDGTRGVWASNPEVKHLIRPLRVFLAAALVAVPFVLASAAGAQSCPVLDPACTVDHVTDDTEDTTDDVTGAVDDNANAARDAVDGTIDGAQDTVDHVQTTVDDTVTKLRDTVDDTTGGADPPGGGTGDHTGGSGQGGEADGTTHRGGTARDGTVGPAVGTSAGAASDTAPGVTDPLVAPADLGSASDDRGAAPTFGQVAVTVIGGVALMALLLGGVAVFLTVQDRLDRRDRKLVPAAIGGDRVRFT
jgi:hypothetical protein